MFETNYTYLTIYYYTSNILSKLLVISSNNAIKNRHASTAN